MGNCNQNKERQDITDMLNSFLGGISLERRLIFMRRYWFVDPVNVIAERYGISVLRVETQLYFVRLQLRKYLREHNCTLSKGRGVFGSLRHIDSQYIDEAEFTEWSVDNS